jgi:SHS2 domain-containing protein
MKRKFEFLEHTADVKIRVYGKSIEKVFENSAYALRKIIIKGKRIKKDKKEGDNLRKERYKIKKRKIKVFGKDYLSLLYNFLEEIIYLVDAENFLVKKIDKINLKNTKNKFFLILLVSGEDFSKYRLTNSIKAITYNEMKISLKKDNSLICEFVLDL